MSKTLDYINSGKDEWLSGKYRPSDEQIEALEKFEKRWEDNKYIAFGQDEDGYYGTEIYVKCGVTLVTHDIFDGQSDDRETVLDGIFEGELSWEKILERFGDDIIDYCNEAEDEDDDEDCDDEDDDD